MKIKDNQMPFKYLDAIQLLERAVSIIEDDGQSRCEIEKKIEWQLEAEEAIEEYNRMYYNK